MGKHVATVVAAILLLAANQPKDDDAKKELDKLQGNWTLEALVVNGKETSAEDAKNYKLTITGDKWSVAVNGRMRDATFTLDPAKKPKGINFTPAAGPQKGKTIHGIYELEGDTLKMCRPEEADKDPPAEFNGKAGSEQLVVVWKRAKP